MIIVGIAEPFFGLLLGVGEFGLLARYGNVMWSLSRLTLTAPIPRFGSKVTPSVLATLRGALYPSFKPL